MVTEQIFYSFGWAPWSSIIAGCVSALAISVILATLGVALGFTVVSPKSDDPTSGLGVAFGAWGAFSVVVSMAAGSFVAGLLAGQRGLEVGFLVWALTVLGAMLFSGIAVGAAVKAIGSAVAGVGSGAANAASTVGRGAMDMASHVFTELKENIHFDFDAEKINDNVLGVLRDTGIETLQPEYLRDQLRETKSSFRGLLHQLALNPSEYERITAEFLDKAKQRLGALTQNIDKEAAATALMNTRNIPREEAVKMVDNAVTAYDQVLEKARETLAETKVQVEEAKKQVKALTDKAREKADNLASLGAKTALAAALALIVAAAISMGSGYYGAQYASYFVPVAGQVQNVSIGR